MPIIRHHTSSRTEARVQARKGDRRNHRDDKAKAKKAVSKLHPLAYAAGELMRIFFGAEPKRIFTSERGSPKDATFRQLVTYLVHVEGNIGEAEAATIMQRDRSTVRHAAREIEDARDDPDVDEAVREIGASLTRLYCMSQAFASATVEFSGRTKRSDWIEGLRAAGKALRELSEGPPEAARVLTAPPAEALALLQSDAVRKILRGLKVAIPGEAPPEHGPYIELGAVEGGKRTLRVITRGARHVADDVLKHGKLALIAAGMRIVMADAWRAPRGGYAAVFKVAPEPQKRALEDVNAQANPKDANRTHKSSPMSRS